MSGAVFITNSYHQCDSHALFCLVAEQLDGEKVKNKSTGQELEDAKSKFLAMVQYLSLNFFKRLKHFFLILFFLILFFLTIIIEIFDILCTVHVEKESK